MFFNQKLCAPIFFASLILSLPRIAGAFDYVQRCDNEWEVIGEVSPRHIEGRHAWAARCGVLSREKLDSIWHGLGFMASFTRSGYGNNDVAPTDPDAPCDPAGTWRLLTMCPLGCFAETQEVLFGYQALTIPDAVSRGEQFVASLHPSSTPLKLVVKPRTKIAMVISGEEKHGLVHIGLAHRGQVLVTRDHPMILASGELRPASSLDVGDFLAALDGPREVVAISSRQTNGHVWNVRPASTNLHANILLTQGVLSGSIRFQNEWAGKVRKIWMMNHIDAEDIESLAPFYFKNS